MHNHLLLRVAYSTIQPPAHSLPILQINCVPRPEAVHAHKLLNPPPHPCPLIITSVHTPTPPTACCPCCSFT